MNRKRYEILSTDDPRPTRHSRWTYQPLGRNEFPSIVAARKAIAELKARPDEWSQATFWVRQIGHEYPVPLP